MQFGIGAGDHGCGNAGNAWATYGADGDGDGDRDVYDPADAIPAAARYLRASGAPGDYRRAIFAYNHADWYVARVLDQAARYRGALAAADSPRAPVRRRAVRRDLAGARARDRHALRRAHRRRRPVRAPTLRPAADRVLRRLRPRGRRRAPARPRHRPRARRRRLGPHAWRPRAPSAGRPSCAANGCAGTVRAPMRVVLYNGYPGHGDPAHCPPPVVRAASAPVVGARADPAADARARGSTASARAEHASTATLVSAEARPNHVTRRRRRRDHANSPPPPRPAVARRRGALRTRESD